MIKLVIIADDLTGALDTGVQFSKKNISTIVTADLNTEEISKDADVIVIDTESRHISAVEAKKRVKSVLSKFDKKKIKFFYKKTALPILYLRFWVQFSDNLFVLTI